MVQESKARPEEGLWSLEFFSNVALPTGSGVVVLHAGRILGGDTRYYYVGEYSIQDKTVSATVTFTHFFGPPDAVVGSGQRFRVTAKGEFDTPTFMVSGRLVEDPGITLDIHLTRRADLPCP